MGVANAAGGSRAATTTGVANQKKAAREPPLQLDYALLLQLLEVGSLQPKHPAVNLCVMLSEQWGTSDLGRRIFEFDRTSGHGEFPAYGMVDGDNHPTLLQMRVVEQFDTVEHGATRHPGLAHYLHHFMFGALAGPILDKPGQLLDILFALLAVLEAGSSGTSGWPMIMHRACHISGVVHSI